MTRSWPDRGRRGQADLRWRRVEPRSTPPAAFRLWNATGRG